MAKSLEFLGFATVNIFIGLVAVAMFVKHPTKASVSTLTPLNVEAFVREVAGITGGQKPDMDSFAITDYLMKHVSDQSVFKSTISYTVPGEQQPGERSVAFGKTDYITAVLEAPKEMAQRETDVKIENIKIADDGRSATVITINTEKGLVPMDDGMGGKVSVPVTSTSYCEQTMILNDKAVMQMDGATCSTDMSVVENN